MRLPPLIAQELDACGLPWRVELGGKHYKLIVCDKFVGVLARDQRKEAFGDRRRNLNIRAQIRRVAKEHA